MQSHKLHMAELQVAMPLPKDSKPLARNRGVKGVRRGVCHQAARRRQSVMCFLTAEGGNACLGVAGGQGLLIAGLHNGAPLASFIHEEVSAPQAFQACFGLLQWNSDQLTFAAQTHA